MFKKKQNRTRGSATEPTPAPAPAASTVSPMEDAAQRAIARGNRIKSLSDEARMWRLFGESCKPGRFILEHISLGFTLGSPAPLHVSMDEDTALLWKAFADQMASERERRLKDLLG